MRAAVGDEDWYDLIREDDHAEVAFIDARLVAELTVVPPAEAGDGDHHVREFVRVDKAGRLRQTGPLEPRRALVSRARIGTGFLRAVYVKAELGLDEDRALRELQQCPRPIGIGAAPAKSGHTHALENVLPVATIKLGAVGFIHRARTVEVNVA